MRTAIIALCGLGLACGSVSAQVFVSPPSNDPAPRQAPGSIDGGPSAPPAPSESLAPLPQAAPLPGPYGSGGPVAPVPFAPAPFAPPPPPPPPGFWMPTNPAGQQRGWLQGELLIWWIKSAPNATPLATNGNLNDAVPGAFGQPGTTAVLLGGQNLNYDASAGFRLAGGYWFGDAARWGIDGSIFFLGQQTVHRGIVSDDGGNPGIFRPVTDTITGEWALPVSAPGMVSGAMFESSSTRLWGADVNGLFRLVQRDTWNFAIIGGFKFLDLRESLNISAYSNDFAGVLPDPVTGNAEVAGTNLAVYDSFVTQNAFYGGQVGFQTNWAFAPRWYLGARVQVGIGDTHQTVTINGLTVQDQPGIGVNSFPAGVLATAGNSGRFSHDAFSIVPEAQLKVGYQFSPHFSGFLGYNFLYWSSVVRPGTQISRTIDLGGVPTSGIYNPAVAPTAPGPPSFAQSGFWAQGINFGLQFSY